MRMPDDDALQPITKAVRQKLRSEIKRTEITAMALLRDADDIPEGLTVAHVNRWISGIVKAARQLHIDYVLGKWASLGNSARRIGADGLALPKRGRRHASDARSIGITQEMQAQLRAEMVRTAIGFATILNDADDAPTGLNSRIIRGWLYRDVQTADEGHWNFVIARYAALPDGMIIPGPITRPRKAKNLHVTLP